MAEPVVIDPANYEAVLQMWRNGSIRNEKWQILLLDPAFEQYVIDHPVQQDASLMKNPAAPLTS